MTKPPPIPANDPSSPAVLPIANAFGKSYVTICDSTASFFGLPEPEVVVRLFLEEMRDALSVPRQRMVRANDPDFVRRFMV